MNWRIILVVVITLGVIAFVAFPDEAMKLIGQDKKTSFSCSSSSKQDFEATFSVIRYKGEAVSVQPVVGREKVMHFQLSEKELTKVLGIEVYLENKGLIRQYKSPMVPMTIPSKGDFTHRLEKCKVIPPQK